ncbi:MAG: mechanosensitive ion channel family protein, partial [Acidobacteria bacterium]|nr:mechanosensitive ion channel family protein [Acidobacteriota bacterium]
MATEKEKVEIEVEQLKGQEDVRRALKQAGAVKEEEKPVVETRQKLWIWTYLLLLMGLGGLFYLIRLGFLDFAGKYLPLLNRFTLAAMAAVLVLAAFQVINIYMIGRLDDAASRYNLTRILKLLVWLILAFLFLSILFANLYTTIVSLGLLSLILGFALQTPITSFIGWVYIMVRSPYRVGDRIRIGDATGDVIDVSYLDTTLWEFGGILSTEHPSGRVIKFPNSNVLDTAVYNYSWPLFPYIWNEISFQVAYDSDLEFVSKTMREIAEEELGPAMMERVRTYRELLAQTPVDQLEVREHPSVLFRVNQNTWVEAIVRYLVRPREAGRVKT